MPAMPRRLARYCPLTGMRPFTLTPVARRFLKDTLGKRSGRGSLSDTKTRLCAFASTICRPTAFLNVTP